MPDLLIELFSEEIPARMQKRAGEDLKKIVTDGLVEAGLTYASAAAFTTPRRLTLTIDGLTEESPNTREERKGPKVGAPEKAVEGFLRSTGLSMDQLEVRDDKKGQVYFAVIEKQGRPAADIVAEVLEGAIRNFPWPKSMRWGAGVAALGAPAAFDPVHHGARGWRDCCAAGRGRDHLGRYDARAPVHGARMPSPSPRLRITRPS